MESAIPTTWSLFLDALISGSAIMVAVGCLGGGFWIGYTRTSVFGIVIWAVIALTSLCFWFFTSDALAYLLNLETALQRWGEAGRVDVATAIYMHMALYPTLLLSGLLVGWRILRRQCQALQEQSQRITPEQFVRQLDVVGNHPQIALAVWFQSRWSTMDAIAKREWATEHIVGLRLLWLEAEGQGLELHGEFLPMRLAQIDINA